METQIKEKTIERALEMERKATTLKALRFKHFKTTQGVANFNYSPEVMECLSPITGSGHSRQLSNWIRWGLKYVKRSDKRFFFQQDVIEYLWKGLVAKYPI